MPKKTYHFKIMQLKREESLNRDFLFARYSRAEKAGGVLMENYEEVYSGELEWDASVPIPCVLEQIYSMLNLNHPADYKTRSLSVSDIVSLAIKEDEKEGEACFENYYVDSCGFQKLEKV